MWCSLPQTFQPILPYNPYQALCFQQKFVWIQVYLNTSFCLVLHNTQWSVHQINFQPIFTAPSLTGSSLYTYTLLTPSPSLMVPFFPITYQYHISHSSPHTQLIFLPYMVFEWHHNIQNQPISTTIPSPSLFRNISTIRKHQHFGHILKYVFSYVFQDSLAYS